MKFRIRPTVIIDAIHWTGDNTTEVLNFANDPERIWFDDSGSESRIRVPDYTDDGDYAIVGDWLVRGLDGDFVVCTNRRFEAIYEPVEAHSSDKENSGVEK